MKDWKLNSNKQRMNSQKNRDLTYHNLFYLSTQLVDINKSNRGSGKALFNMVQEYAEKNNELIDSWYMKKKSPIKGIYQRKQNLEKND